jgi:hypothetical protein
LNSLNLILHPLLANRFFLNLRKSNDPETQLAVSGIIFVQAGTVNESGAQGQEDQVFQ